ncbi:MAG: hypothetical protein B1H11_02075 [Desulfobacteraceae bacterium 4484_190.1]|nr:MAG: hypothetical protein B1H11_02075 [Desulfobacteraceae bacterium 4484_190.1]
MQEMFIGNQKWHDYSAEYFAYEYRNGRRRTRNGINVKRYRHTGKQSVLKRQISFLKDKLAVHNLGEREKLFVSEDDGYRPGFEPGIILYRDGAFK